MWSKYFSLVFHYNYILIHRSEKYTEARGGNEPREVYQLFRLADYGNVYTTLIAYAWCFKI